MLDRTELSEIKHLEVIRRYVKETFKIFFVKLSVKYSILFFYFFKNKILLAYAHTPQHTCFFLKDFFA